MLTILNNQMVLASALVIVSFLTDVVDGRVARMLNQETEFGRIIDTLFDKVTFIAIVACLSAIGRLPIWATTLMIGREVIILGTGLYLIMKGLNIIEPHMYSRITSVVFLLMEIVYIIAFTSLLSAVLYTALVSMTIAFIKYLQQFGIRSSIRRSTRDEIS